MHVRSSPSQNIQNNPFKNFFRKSPRKKFTLFTKVSRILVTRDKGQGTMETLSLVACHLSLLRISSAWATRTHIKISRRSYTHFPFFTNSLQTSPSFLRDAQIFSMSASNESSQKSISQTIVCTLP